MRNWDIGEVFLEKILSRYFHLLYTTITKHFCACFMPLSTHLPTELESCSIERSVEYTSWAPAEFVSKGHICAIRSGQTAAE
jgi:hypothetical protein